MFLSYPAGTFKPDALDKLADEITRAGEKYERLPLTEFVLSTTWVYAREYPKEQVYHGGKPGGANFISLDINVLQGGFNATTKRQLIKSVTDSIEKHGNLPNGEPRRVYVLIREVAEANWGFDGGLIDLEALRNTDPNATPL